MSGRQYHEDGAFPRASLLCYFRNSRRQSSPSTTDDVERGPLLPEVSKEVERDTKLRLMDAGADDYEEEEEDDASWGFEELLTGAIFALVMLLMVMNIDMFMSRFGVAVWDWKGATSVQGGDLAKVYFCRVPSAVTLDDTPTWRYITSDSYKCCTTEIITLTMSSSELSKLKTGENVRLGGCTGSPEKEEEGKFLSGTHAVETEAQDKSNDPAEEREFRHPIGNSMHAGFGGPWKWKL